MVRFDTLKRLANSEAVILLLCCISVIKRFCRSNLFNESHLQINITCYNNYII